MHRLIIALTALLTLTGVVVVGAYLFLFAASPDRAARVAPADTVAYVNVYLQPSAGQQANLNGLLTRFPGFGDPATLDDKIDETLQRFLTDAGVDYRADVKPWLGDQLAVAFSHGAGDLDEMAILLIAAARDPDEALAAIPRLAASRGDELREEEHAGTRIWIGSEASYAIVEEMVVIGDQPDRVRAAIDAGRGAASSLADRDAFVSAMEQLPADHLASAYIDLVMMTGASDADQDELAGYSTASMALIAEGEGLRLSGQAPFAAGEAGEAARRAFALATEPSSLTGWMPADTQVSVVFFGARQAIEAAEEEAGLGGELGELTMALNQLRAIAGFALGINVDADLLPLLDREAALALTDVATDPPGAVLLLRPSDGEEAVAALQRMSAALEQRGSQVSTSELAGVTVTTVVVPELAELSWAASDGVILMGMDPEAIRGSIEAQQGGRSLASSAEYRATFDLVERHAGNEIYVDARGLLELASTAGELPADMRAMLGPIQALGLTIPAGEDRLEFHLVLPID